MKEVNHEVNYIQSGSRVSHVTWCVPLKNTSLPAPLGPRLYCTKIWVDISKDFKLSLTFVRKREQS